MPSRIYRRNPVSAAFAKISKRKWVKLFRAMLKKRIIWENRREQQREISVLSSRLQIPPGKVPELYKGRKYASEVVKELRHMVQVAEQAGLERKQTKAMFEKASIEQARAYFAQLAEAA